MVSVAAEVFKYAQKPVIHPQPTSNFTRMVIIPKQFLLVNPIPGIIAI